MTNNLISPSAGADTNINLDLEDDWSRLFNHYPNAITDFYGSGMPCVYKTGPAWPIIDGEKTLRAERPIYDHPIGPTWVETAWAIGDVLDSLGVNWGTIDPLAYANAGDAALICDFVIVITVQPRSLEFSAAVTAGNAVNEILINAGFPDIQIAFVEGIYRTHARPGGPKFMGLDPTVDLLGLPEIRKPFTPTLGLSIATFESSHPEGTGGLLLRLSSEKNDTRVGLLTCAHVLRPPSLSTKNEDYTREDDSQPRKDVVLLGDEAFQNAVHSITKFIKRHMLAISSWESSLMAHPAQKEMEDKRIASKRSHLTDLIRDAKAEIEEAKKLHTYVTQNLADPESRVLGHVVHIAKIEIGATDKYMYDWGFVQLDSETMDIPHFQGNKLFVGGDRTLGDWIMHMRSQPPQDMLLPIKGFVTEDELRNPQDVDIYKKKALLAVKNGSATGTTFGRVNGLESITRKHPHHDSISQRALEIIVCGCDTSRSDNALFSIPGDSGSCVVDREGRLIGLLTSGVGPIERTDRTYITPYFALKKVLEQKFPGCHLFDDDV